MGHAYHDIAFTDTVKALQQTKGSRAAYARFEDGPTQSDNIGPEEAMFIAQRDSVYMASISETGWPYVQHRGGPTGFLRVLDESTLGFADFAGNKQYVSLGNFRHDDRVSLFFMDYANRRRLKLFGRVSVVDPDDKETLNQLQLPYYRAKVERGIMIKVEGFDWNCPQHITRRFSESQVAQAVNALTTRISELEAQLEEAKHARSAK
ncbi:MAG: pyridoxamine 5'-phosphate oxidase family protein [Pseudomonadota bacterium]